MRPSPRRRKSSNHPNQGIYQLLEDDDVYSIDMIRNRGQTKRVVRDAEHVLDFVVGRDNRSRSHALTVAQRSSETTGKCSLPLLWADRINPWYLCPGAPWKVLHHD